MITITIQGQNELLTNGMFLFAIAGGWQPEIDGEPNPVTIEEFVSNNIKQFFLDKVVEGAAKVAESERLKSLSNAKEAFNTITILTTTE